MHRFTHPRAASAALAAALVAAVPSLAAQHAASHHAAHAAMAATPKQQNQFTTVDEFVKAALPPHTAVSLEGYAVLGYRTSDGSETVEIVDSIDHVLNPTDANNLGHAGGRAVIPAAQAHRAGLAWTGKGLERVVMYTGAGRAQKSLHDTVSKIRVTGYAARKAVISPVTKVEYQDENGDWKSM